jgi:hypothetical protein
MWRGRVYLLSRSLLSAGLVDSQNVLFAALVFAGHFLRLRGDKQGARLAGNNGLITGNSMMDHTFLVISLSVSYSKKKFYVEEHTKCSRYQLSNQE